MANTKLIRSKIKSVGNLQKIIKALEIVSTIKLQKLKNKTNTFKLFMLDFLRVLESLKDRVNLFDFDRHCFTLSLPYLPCPLSVSPRPWATGMMYTIIDFRLHQASATL